MLACTFVHRKFLARTLPGKAVLRAFLGGMKNEALLTEPDDVLVATVRRELNEILGITADPEYQQVSRWRRAMAQYAVGHQERTKRIAAHVAALPGLRLVGNAYDGIGIPDCIRLGRLAAKELVASQPAAAGESAGQGRIGVVPAGRRSVSLLRRPSRKCACSMGHAAPGQDPIRPLQTADNQVAPDQDPFHGK